MKYNPKTGEILDIYDQPSEKTDAVAMQHDVDYSICKDDKKCKNKADRKMVSASDAIPYKDRQWGHWLARNLINAKQKLGLGAKQTKKKPKYVKRRLAKKKKSRQQRLPNELHKAVKRHFTRRRVIANHIDEIWASDLVEMQNFSK